jgi:hypothetical protein
MVVWKYPLEPKVGGYAFIDVPDPDARIVHFGVQGETLCVWVELTPEPAESAGHSPLEVVVVGTGHPLPPGKWTHRGTTEDGPFIWHLYEATP